jgi:hypothetical protein
MKTRNLISVLLLLAIVIGACSSDPQLDGVKLKMKAITSQSSLNGRTSATGLSFTEVKFGVREIEFEMEDDDDDDDTEEVEFEGAFTVDLIAGTSNPSFGLADVASGVYDEIEIELAPVMADGNSIFISFTKNGITYEFSSKQEFDIEIEDANGYTIDANALTNILVLVNLDVLFANVNLDNAIADEDGVVRINETSNSSLASQIINQLEDSCDVDDDDDD